MGICVRAVVIGAFGDPLRTLEQPAEGCHELVAGHLVDLVQSEDTVTRRAGNGWPEVLTDVVEDEVQHNGGDAAQRDSAAQDDLGPLGNRM